MITTQYKNEVFARAEKYNKKGGRVMSALERAFAACTKNGDNVVVKFVDEMQGLPYGDDGMSMDDSADCSQFVIDTLYYFFGVKGLGSWTESIYSAEKDPSIPLDKIKPLMIILYNFKKGRHASHAALVIDKLHIAHTRSPKKPLMYSAITYENDDIVKICDFITDEQREQVIYYDVDDGLGTGDVDPVEYDNTYKYVGATFTNFRAGAGVQYKRIAKVSKGKQVKRLSVVNSEWWQVEYNGAVGYVANVHLFKRV